MAPANIIAFTFTEKAAAELKERIHRRTREALGEVPGLAEMFVGTIHAFCLELLKSETNRYLKFEVLNEVQQGLFVDRHSRQSGLTTTVDLNGRSLRRYVDTRRYLAALSMLREATVVPEVVAGTSILEGLSSYRELLEDRSYLDYSAILEIAVNLLESDEGIRERLAERVKYVIVDEYQDVNPIQERIVRQFHELGARLCVVGDDDQTIYQWRGSDVRNIVSFAKRYPDVTTVAIEENHRSSKGVIETARLFIEQNAGRLRKHMRFADAQPFETGDCVALSFKNPEEEAEYLAAQAIALRGVAFEEDGVQRGLCWSDMAILLRSVKSSAESIIKAFREAGIPVLVTGMTNLFSAPEAEAARRLFYFMAGRLEGEAVADAWRKADLGVDEAALERAIRALQEAREALSDDDQGRWGQYSIQRVFMGFLENAQLREEQVPGGRGELVFYNLGKFSQLISDFESIHFHSKPAEKYESFAQFLQYRAEDSYPEGWQDNQYANPDAVRIMTVHQAKGMQWPVVFIPALLRNRFPAAGVGGATEWHLVPVAAIEGHQRYRGTIEDERRLFYVAMTRSQRFLHMTWAPIPGKNNRYSRPSEFWEAILASEYVKRRVPDYSNRSHLEPQQRLGITNVVFSFSDLKYYFECPYQFKLRILFGFNAPIHEALGYGKSLHDALSEVHARAIRGEQVSADDAPNLIETHMHTPFAYPALRQQLEESAQKVIENYLADNAEVFDQLEFSEKAVEIDLGDGIAVNGRIDLVRRLDTGKTTIVDLKSNERSQAEETTEVQLHVYALGYKELTGRRPDYVEIYELDERRKKPRSVDDEFIAEVSTRVRTAAGDLRRGSLSADPDPRRCKVCDYRGMCSAAAEE